MSFKKPLFWDLKKPTLLSNFLYPFSYLIRFNNFINEKKLKKKSDKIKTICIGNIYLGGTGKTPTTIKLFNIVKKLKRNVVTGKKTYLSHTDEILILKKKLLYCLVIQELRSSQKLLKKKMM